MGNRCPCNSVAVVESFSVIKLYSPVVKQVEDSTLPSSLQPNKLHNFCCIQIPEPQELNCLGTGKTAGKREGREGLESTHKQIAGSKLMSKICFGAFFFLLSLLQRWSKQYGLFSVMLIIEHFRRGTGVFVQNLFPHFSNLVGWRARKTHHVWGNCRLKERKWWGKVCVLDVTGALPAVAPAPLREHEKTLLSCEFLWPCQLVSCRQGTAQEFIPPCFPHMTAITCMWWGLSSIPWLAYRTNCLNNSKRVSKRSRSGDGQSYISMCISLWTLAE